MTWCVEKPKYTCAKCEGLPITHEVIRGKHRSYFVKCYSCGNSTEEYMWPYPATMAWNDMNSVIVRTPYEL